MGGLIVFVAFLTSPSHSVGSELAELQERYLFITSKSPSHPVGLERYRECYISGSLGVTIPPSGLGTKLWQYLVAKVVEMGLPSHAVGLEWYLAWEVGTGKTMSLSHTVGLEQINFQLSEQELIYLSPSHAVGLELPEEGHASVLQAVSIPPSGLRTRMGNWFSNRKFTI